MVAFLLVLLNKTKLGIRRKDISLLIISVLFQFVIITSVKIRVEVPDSFQRPDGFQDTIPMLHSKIYHVDVQLLECA